MFLEFLESLVWFVGLVVLAFFLILFSFAFFVSYEGPEARKKREAAEQLRKAKHEKLMVEWKSLDVRRSKLREIALLVAHSKPCSDEESRLLDLAEAMNLTFGEWKDLSLSISGITNEYLPDTRPHIYYRQLRVLESNAG